ncbi:MAG TPA: NAD(+) diphosphatase [Lachnospiraceae bacterium]
MIQDIEPKVLDNSYHPREAKKGDFVIAYMANQLWMVEKGESFRYPLWEDYEGLFEKKEKLQYLFTIDEKAFYLDFLTEEKIKAYEKKSHLPINLTLQPISIFREFAPLWVSLAGVTARHLAKWYKRNIYCGKCGNKMQHSQKERAMQCPKCGFIDYPKICPAVIVAIVDEDKILLTKYQRPNARYALVAGFCEIGESVEETIRREVYEEVGLKVKNIRYYKSQPWGFSESLLMGFFADLDGDNKVVLDTKELSEAEWVKREDIPNDSEKELTLTYTMINAFKEKNYPRNSFAFERRSS